MPKPRPTFREALASDQPLVTPLAHDALSARLIERAGFKAFAIGGSAMLAARHAYPDIGLIGLTDMVAGIRDIAASNALPFFADGCAAALWDALAGAPAASMAEQLSRPSWDRREVEHKNTRHNEHTITHRHTDTYCGVSDGGGNARRYSFRTPNKGELALASSARTH